MKPRIRELALVVIVVALIFAFTVELRRGEQMPAPPEMLAFVVGMPRADIGRCVAAAAADRPPRKIVDA